MYYIMEYTLCNLVTLISRGDDHFQLLVSFLSGEQHLDLETG
jgi:hypothetical protein